MAGGITFPECSCVRLSVRLCVSLKLTLLAECLRYLLTDCDQTFTTNGVLGKDKRIKIWSQKVKGQGHSEVKYAPKMQFLVL